MKVPKRAIDAYAAALDKCAGAAGKQAANAVRAFARANPGADVAQMREFAIAAVFKAVGDYGNAASAMACQLFDEIMDAEGIAADAAQVVNPVDPEAIGRGVRYQAGNLVEGDSEAFVSGVSELAGYHARKAANRTIAANVARTGGVRYARVPSGPTACEWCLMLASRGFVYSSEESAAAGNHRNCHCMCVPGVPGKTSVAGYDPDALYEQWKTGSAFRTISREHTASQDLAATNPGFAKGGTAYRYNCQRCVPTYEMRRRGHDVVAKPAVLNADGKPDHENDPIQEAWGRKQYAFDGQTFEKCLGTGKPNCDSHLKEWGDGARAEVYVEWRDKNFAHVFVGENRNGSVVYIDPQTGEEDVGADYFSKCKANRTQIARIDNLEPSELIDECCTSRGGNP